MKKLLKKFDQLSGRAKLALSTAALFFAYLPYLLILYPGAFGYDECWALLQTAGSGSLSISAYGNDFYGHFAVDHKPIIHTLLLGLFYHFGDFIGSQNIGIFSLVVLQTIGLAFAASLSIRFLHRMCPPVIVRVSFLFFLIFPGIPLSFACPANDNIYSLLFIIWMIDVICLFLYREKFLEQKASLITFILVCVGLVIFKKTGIFIVLPSLLFFLFFPAMKALRKRLLICLGAAMAAYICIPLLVFPLADVVAGGKQEALAPFIQQTAAYATAHPEEISAEQKDVLEKVVNLGFIVEVYDPTTQDPIKHGYKQDATLTDLVSYLGVWVQQGITHPDTYLKAWWGIDSAYIAQLAPLNYIDNNPRDNIGGMVDFVISHHEGKPFVTDVSDEINLASPEEGLQAQRVLRSFIDKVNRSPLKLLVTPALYATWIPIVAFILTLKRRKDLLPVFIPVAFTMVFVYLSPIISFRYVLPLVCIAPLLLGMPFMKSRQGND